MDDNVDSTSRDQKPNKQPSADNKRIDSIPLWLQGIAENAAASREPDESEWQKEQTFVANQDTGPTPIEITEIESSEEIKTEPDFLDESLPEEKKAPLPNWIEESMVPIDDEQTIDISLRELDETGDKLDEITEEIIVEEMRQTGIAEPIEDESVATIHPTEDTDLAPWEKGVHVIPPDEIGAETTAPVPSVDNSDLAPWEKASEIISPEEIESEIVETIPTSSESDTPPWEQASEVIHIESIETENELPVNDEIISETEEIPDWLREMIAADEKQQKEADELRRQSLSDEPTQPVVVSSESDRIEQPPTYDIVEEPDAEPAESELEDSHPEETNRPAVMPTARLNRLFGEPAQEETPENEPEEAELPSLDDFDIKLERDFTADYDGSGFQPIQFDPPIIDEQIAEEASDEIEDEPEQGETTEEQTEFVLEDWRTPSQPEEFEPETPEEEPLVEPGLLDRPDETVSEQSSNEDIPASLIEAKQTLEHGEVKEALAVIRSYISQSQYLDEIKDWLLSANNKFEKNKAGLWEALGDISSHQGDYSSALSSYAKAIQFLELSRKNLNEIS